MYTPPHFLESRDEALHRLLHAHPLGVLVVHGSEGLDANHLPFLLDADRGGHGVLLAHVARANPVWQQVADGDAVLVVFRGAQGYVSPNWYPSKHEHHRHVPTWNYEVVHAHGRIRIRDDASFVRGVVARLTREHEAGEPKPWKMGDAPADYIADLVTKIVGLEVEVTRWEGKRKLSQNREARDFQGVVDALEAGGEADLAAAMRAVEG
jgi:transcriptional regulator